ncbi:MAG TPA: hypothetical protein VI542_02105 [Candidatus Tectomicrobia bacterium]
MPKLKRLLFVVLAGVLWAAGGAAEPQRVRLPEGNVHGFLIVRTLAGEVIAHGELVQKPTRGLLTSRMQAAWQEAGHPGQGEVRLRLPIYVAEDMDRARSEPQASAMPSYERVLQAYLRSAQTFENPARAARAARLATLTYADVLHTRVVFGTLTLVTEWLSTLRQEVGLSGIIIEPNIG